MGRLDICLASNGRFCSVFLWYRGQDSPGSIGRIANFFGNFGVLARAYAYILMLGREGLTRVSEQAVLNANYLMHRLKKYYDLPFDRPCMHEFVLSAGRQLQRGVHAMDIAKYLIDRGVHPPTVYFPLIVKEAMMIEPTETETKETLDRFAAIMLQIDREIDENLDLVLSAPHDTPVRRLDEVQATKTLDVCYKEQRLISL